MDNRLAFSNRNPSKTGAGDSAGARSRISFRDVYDRTFSFVLRAAKRLGVDDRDLDDVTQEVFLTVYRRLSDFEGRSSVKTWVSSILGKLVQNYRRSKRRKGGVTPQAPEIDPEEIPDASTDPWALAQRADARQVLHKLLGQLSKDKALVFVMVELEGMTAVEVAKLMKANIDTTYSRLRVARREFSVALAQMNGQDEGIDIEAELSPRAQQFLRDAASNDDPTADDARRVHQSVMMLIAKKVNPPGES